MSAQVRTVQVELPAEAFEGRRWDAEEVAEELRLLFLVELVRDRRLAYGKAAELAGMPIPAFVRYMGRHGVGPFDYDPGELADEMQSK
jgi:predicted HTH domain antitoxin